MRFCRKLGLLLLVVLLAACHPIRPKDGTSLDNMQHILNQGILTNQAMAARESKLPKTVNDELIPDAALSVPVLPSEKEKHFNIAVSNVPAARFFAGLAQGTPYSIVVGPTVTGNISLDLKNVSLIDTLKAVRDTYGYDFKKTDYGYEVLPAGLQTKVFKVNYLDLERTGETETRVNGGQPTNVTSSENLTGVGTNQTGEGGGGGSVTNTGGGGASVPLATSIIRTKSKTAFWVSLKASLEAMVGTEGGRKVVVDSLSGVVVVRAFPSELREIGGYLHTVQNTMNREVILEAKILEVRLSHGFETGINWHILGAALGRNVTNNSGTDINGNSDQRAFNFTDNIFTLNVKGGDFQLLVKALSSQGNVQVLSSPNLSTVNNQKAVIKVGTDEYFVTDVSTTSTSEGGVLENNQDIDLTPFFSGIALDVTPQIADNGEVILHIHPSVSDIENQKLEVQIGDNEIVLPSAKSTIRESDTIVRAKSGQTVVIGGLMQNHQAEGLEGAPFIDRIPFLGALFRDSRQESLKSELVILLRPVVVGPGTWENQLHKSADNMQKLKRGFHFGSYPHVFGNLAEHRHYDSASTETEDIITK